jgi:ElaB/YqjD/DUF883 family membrane-anchored ribosome-binding protein
MATQTAAKNGTPIADKVTETLHESVEQLGQQAAKTEESIRRGSQQGAKSIEKNQIKAKKMWDQSAVGKYTKEHPVASAGIAFAAGLLVSSLLTKK